MVGPGAEVMAGAVVVWLDGGGAAVVVAVGAAPAAGVLPPQAAARIATAASGTPNPIALLESRPGMVSPSGAGCGTGHGLSSRVHIPYVPGGRKACVACPEPDGVIVTPPG